jgi:hypothetical protein
LNSIFSPQNLKGLVLKLAIFPTTSTVTCMFCREGFASVKTVTSINDIPADVSFYCLSCLENTILPPFKLAGAKISRHNETEAYKK